MADTTTTNLNLTKPEIGGAEDTWGVSINSNLDTIDALFGSSGSTVNFGSVQVAGTNGVNIQQGAISIKNGGTQSRVDFYCESSNAHYARLQAPAHSAFSGNVTLTLPASTGSLVGTGDSGTVTNTMLAGSIANAKLANSSATLNSQTLTLGGSLTLDTDNIGEGSSNLYFTNERVDDRVNALLVAGSNITLTYDDAGNTLTIAASGGGSGTVTEAFKTISVSGQDNIVADSATDTLTVAAGSGITLTTNASTDTLTITNSGSASNSFETIAVSGQSNVVADSGTDTLTLVAGSNMTITTDASTDTITFASTASGGSGGSSSSFTKNTFTGDGSTTAFTLSKSVSNEDNLIVFIDAAYQADNVYSVSGTTLTFATAPVNTRLIEVFIIEGGIVGTAPVIDTMTGDGSDTTLALSTTPASENQTFVTIDGVVQHKSTYSVSGSTLTFSEAPPNGSAVECITFVNVALATFQDADGDTKVQVEESTDEDKIRFDIAGTEEMVMDASGIVINDGSNDRDFRIESNDSDGMLFVDGGNNRVGIGTSSPGTILHTRTSDATSNNNAGGGFYHISSATAGTRRASLFLDADNGNFSTSSDGAYAYIEKIGGGGNLNIRNQDSSSIAFFRSSSESMRIDSSGNVGIGTTTPTSKLQVATANGTLSHFGGIATTNTHYTGISLGYSEAANANYRKTAIVQEQLADGAARGNLHFLVDTAADANSASLADSKMMFHGISGDVYIGKTSSSFASAGIEFRQNGGADFTRDDGNVINVNRTTSNGTVLEFYKDGSSVGSISTNANSLPSDFNFKKDITDLDLGLNLINKLKPSQYNYKIDDKDCPKMYGLIAQDLEQALQEVGVEKNSIWLLQHEPNDDENQSDYSLDYTKLIPILINSIQELTAKVEELEGKIE